LIKLFGILVDAGMSIVADLPVAEVLVGDDVGTGAG